MKIIAHLTCVIFTVLILVFVSFSFFDMTPALSNTIAIQGFIMSLSVATLMFICDRIRESNNLIVDTVIKISICYLVVFLEGSYFKMIEFSWRGLVEITPALILIFIVTYVVQYFTCVDWANSINKSIRHKNEDRTIK